MTDTDEMLQYLEPTQVIDSDNKKIIEFAHSNSGNSPDPVDRAVALYYSVRDSIRYDPYRLDLSVKGLRASTTLEQGWGWCVAKAILLAACCRVQNIPARLGYADIRNHLSTARMREVMKTDIFYWHGYTSIFLEGNWVKATPAFNIELCEKFRIRPLEFDGRTDSIYHPFDLDGNRHMEYLNYRGEFADAPIDQMIGTFREKYTDDLSMEDADFDSDVDRETS